MRSLNTARILSASSNVKRLRVGVIAIARLTLANMAADSGVLLGIILVRSLFDIFLSPRTDGPSIILDRDRVASHVMRTRLQIPYHLGHRFSDSVCCGPGFSWEIGRILRL